MSQLPKVGQNLRRLRNGLGLSLDEASKLTGVSKAMLGQIERGESSPTISTLWKISSGLKVNFISLLDDNRNQLVLVKKDEIHPIKEENGYLPDLDAIPEEILARTKYMIVSYPLNPVCVCAPDEFYERLIIFAKEHDIIIIHDNAYSDIIYTRKQGRSFLSFDGAKEVGVEFYSLSKSFNLTGARISFVVGNKQIINKLKVFRSQIDYGVFLPVQYAAIAALTGPLDVVEEQRQEYEKRNKMLCGGLRSIGWDVPDSQGTMFVWAKIPGKYKSSVEFCLDLMEKTGVIVTPGNAFGSRGEGYVRMALVVGEETISELLSVLEESNIFSK